MLILLNSNNKMNVEAYCDSNRACNVKELTGYYIKLGDSLLSWKTKNQSKLPGLSQCQEYESMASTHVK